MTPEEQQLEIAEGSGQYQRWKQTIAGKVSVRLVKTPTKDVADYWRSYGCEMATGEPLTDPPRGIPDLNDLNAAHRAWRDVISCDSQLTDRFENHLREIVERDAAHLESAKFYALQTNATGVQRNEAFLKTVGRWKD